jgi:NADPH-dependent 2,4-dienoyl-CoA reductase/sulfur reductase-like enzyme
MSKNERMLVIGGTAAGLSAASKAKRLNPNLDIVVFEKSGYISYGSCGLPYFVGGMIDSPEDLVSMTVQEMQSQRGIEVLIHHEVLALDATQKSVVVRKLETGEIQDFNYDKLVLATGAFPIKPSIEGLDAKGVYFLRNVEDGIALKNAVEKGKKAVIVGGGFIGLELAEELALSGVQVSIFETMDRLLPSLPQSFSNSIKKTLEDKGIVVHLQSEISQIVTQKNSAIAVKTSNGYLEECDLVLLSIGVIPATSLAKEAGLALGLKGSIIVDSHMQTSDPSIWACGDCAEMKNILTGKSTYVPLGTTANKMGRIAGSNIGGEESEFPGVLGSMVTKVFDCFIAATGLSLQSARGLGFNAFESAITKADKASYYPGGANNTLNLVVDANSGRLLGVQGIGSESVVGRINVFVACITANMTVAQVANLDLVYAPPVAPVYDPILIAASQAMKKVRKRTI